MLRPVGAIARYAMCGGAGAAAYDCATNDGSMLSQVIHQLVASASSVRAAGALASTADFGGSAVQRLELAELSAKLDRLASLAVGGFGMSRGASVPLGALLCAAGAIVGGLAVWAVATGRWWPTIQAKLESVEQAIGLVDAKVDARALELAAQLREQHAAILSAVGAVHASVRKTDGKVCQLERRIEQIDETGKENNSGGRSRTLAPPCASRARRAAPPRPCRSRPANPPARARSLQASKSCARWWRPTSTSGNARRRCSSGCTRTRARAASSSRAGLPRARCSPRPRRWRGTRARL